MVDKERLKKLKKQYDFLRMGGSSYQERELPKETITDFSENVTGDHPYYKSNKEDKEVDDFTKQQIVELRKLRQRQDSIRKPGTMLSTNEKLGIPELDKKIGRNFNSIGEKIESCAKGSLVGGGGKSETECKMELRRKERTGKVGWDGSDYRMNPDDSIKNKKLRKQRKDLIERKITENQIKDLEDFGKVVRELKQQITGKRFTDFLEEEEFDSEEEFYRLIEDY